MPVLDRIDWVSRQFEMLRGGFISIGESADASKMKIKITLRPASDAALSESVSLGLQSSLAALRSLVVSHVATDRGHKHSDGSSVISIWIAFAPRHHQKAHAPRQAIRLFSMGETKAVRFGDVDLISPEGNEYDEEGDDMTNEDDARIRSQFEAEAARRGITIHELCNSVEDSHGDSDDDENLQAQFEEEAARRGISVHDLCDDPGYYEHDSSDDEPMHRQFESEAARRGITVSDLCHESEQLEREDSND